MHNPLYLTALLVNERQAQLRADAERLRAARQTTRRGHTRHGRNGRRT